MCEMSTRTLLDEEAATKFQRKSSQGLCSDPSELSFPSSLQLVLILPHCWHVQLVRSVRNVQTASQHKMMQIQMFFFFEKAAIVLYNASVA